MRRWQWLPFPLVAGVALAGVAWQRSRPAPMSHRFAWLLTNPVRRAWVRQVLRQAHVLPGMHVLEVGAGPGVFTELLSRQVRPGGTVHAIDVQPEMLAMAKSRLARQGVSNVILAPADVLSLPFDDATFDLVLMVSVLGEITDQSRALAEVERVLRPGGALSLTEAVPDPRFTPASRVEVLTRGAGLLPETFYRVVVGFTANYRKPLVRR